MTCWHAARAQRLLGWVDRVQRRSRWLGFPFAVMGKFHDHGALTTVIAYNAFFALFPLLLVVVTVLGFLLGRDLAFSNASSARRWPTSPSSATRYKTTSMGRAAAASAW